MFQDSNADGCVFQQFMSNCRFWLLSVAGHRCFCWGGVRVCRSPAAPFWGIALTKYHLHYAKNVTPVCGIQLYPSLFHCAALVLCRCAHGVVRNFSQRDWHLKVAAAGYGVALPADLCQSLSLQCRICSAAPHPAGGLGDVPWSGVHLVCTWRGCLHAFHQCVLQQGCLWG